VKLVAHFSADLHQPSAILSDPFFIRYSSAGSFLRCYQHRRSFLLLFSLAQKTYLSVQRRFKFGAHQAIKHSSRVSRRAITDIRPTLWRVRAGEIIFAALLLRAEQSGNAQINSLVLEYLYFQFARMDRKVEDASGIRYKSPRQRLSQRNGDERPDIGG